MTEKSIEEIINNELPPDDKIDALDFVAFLRGNGFEFIRDKGYWKDKIYFLVLFNNDCVCFISIKDPDETKNRWTVWSDDMSSAYLNDITVENRLKESAWEHVDICGNCGSCDGGRPKIIFGRTFNNVCGCTFRFDNPSRHDLIVLKKIVELRKKRIT